MKNSLGKNPVTGKSSSFGKYKVGILKENKNSKSNKDKGK